MTAAKKFFSYYGRYLFLAVFIADISLILLEAEQWRIFSKPFLMPLLALYVWQAGRSAAGKWFILSGLIFSAAGDTLLLFEKDYSFMFIAGLSCFLITHIFYIIYFLSSVKRKGSSLLKKKPLIIMAVLVYLAGFTYLLFPKLGGLKIPVSIYTVVIGSMLLASLNIYYKLPIKSAFRFALGAFFFVISDSLLAFNKFFQPIPQAGLMIMLTYCLAQFLIAEGYIFANKEG